MTTHSKLYLMCLIPEASGLRRDYTEISRDTEKKITMLYRANKLPKTFSLSGKMIAVETILGFTEQAYLDEPNRPKQMSWDELSALFKQQGWYKTAKAKNAPAVK